VRPPKRPLLGNTLGEVNIMPQPQLSAAVETATAGRYQCCSH
jgi:hypothetical protein